VSILYCQFFEELQQLRFGIKNMLFHVCSVSVLDVRVYIYVHYYVKICLGSRTKERVTDNVLNLNYDKF